MPANTNVTIASKAGLLLGTGISQGLLDCNNIVLDVNNELQAENGAYSLRRGFKVILNFYENGQPFHIYSLHNFAGGLIVFSQQGIYFASEKQLLSNTLLTPSDLLKIDEHARGHVRPKWTYSTETRFYYSNEEIFGAREVIISKENSVFEKSNAYLFKALEPADFSFNTKQTIGWMGAGKKRNMRLCWRREGIDGKSIRSAPSNSIPLENTNTTDADLSFLVPKPLKFTAGDILEVYATDESDAAAGDEMFLVHEEKISTDALEVPVTIKKGTHYFALYTNSTQEGIAAANTVPPYAQVIGAFRQYTVYGDIHTFYQLIIELGNVQKWQTDDTLSLNFAGNTISMKATEGDSNPSLNYFHVNKQEGNLITAYNIARTFNSNGQNFCRASVIQEAGSVYIVFQTIFLSNNIGLLATPFAVNAEGQRDPSGSIDRAGIERLKLAFLSPVAVGDSGTAPTSFLAERRPNRLVFSKPNYPEAVPYESYLDIGEKSKAIIAIQELENYLFVFKEDGIFRLSGNSPATISIVRIDSSIKLVSAESLCVYNNNIAALTNKGVALIGYQSINIISENINYVLDKRADWPSYKKARLIPYESEDRLLLALSAGKSDEGYFNEVFVYNSKAAQWTRWGQRGNLYGHLSLLNRLYYIEQSILFVEKKNHDDNDYSDVDIIQPLERTDAQLVKTFKEVPENISTVYYLVNDIAFLGITYYIFEEKINAFPDFQFIQHTLIIDGKAFHSPTQRVDDLVFGENSSSIFGVNGRTYVIYKQYSTSVNGYSYTLHTQIEESYLNELIAADTDEALPADSEDGYAPIHWIEKGFVSLTERQWTEFHASISSRGGVVTSINFYFYFPENNNPSFPLEERIAKSYLMAEGEMPEGETRSYKFSYSLSDQGLSFSGEWAFDIDFSTLDLSDTSGARKHKNLTLSQNIHEHDEYILSFNTFTIYYFYDGTNWRFYLIIRLSKIFKGSTTYAVSDVPEAYKTIEDVSFQLLEEQDLAKTRPKTITDLSQAEQIALIDRHNIIAYDGGSVRYFSEGIRQNFDRARTVAVRDPFRPLGNYRVYFSDQSFIVKSFCFSEDLSNFPSFQHIEYGLTWGGIEQKSTQLLDNTIFGRDEELFAGNTDYGSYLLRKFYIDANDPDNSSGKSHYTYDIEVAILKSYLNPLIAADTTRYDDVDFTVTEEYSVTEFVSLAEPQWTELRSYSSGIGGDILTSINFTFSFPEYYYRLVPLEERIANSYLMAAGETRRYEISYSFSDQGISVSGELAFDIDFSTLDLSDTSGGEKHKTLPLTQNIHEHAEYILAFYSLIIYYLYDGSDWRFNLLIQLRKTLKDGFDYGISDVPEAYKTIDDVSIELLEEQDLAKTREVPRTRRPTIADLDRAEQIHLVDRLDLIKYGGGYVRYFSDQDFSFTNREFFLITNSPHEKTLYTNREISLQDSILGIAYKGDFTNLSDFYLEAFGLRLATEAPKKYESIVLFNHDGTEESEDMLCSYFALKEPLSVDDRIVAYFNANEEQNNDSFVRLMKPLQYSLRYNNIALGGLDAVKSLQRLTFSFEDTESLELELNIRNDYNSAADWRAFGIQAAGLGFGEGEYGVVAFGGGSIGDHSTTITMPRQWQRHSFFAPGIQAEVFDRNIKMLGLSAAYKQIQQIRK